MVHWPEVMFTYEQTSRTLFTADAFGAFGALDGILFDSQLADRSAYFREMRRYYATVIGKYGGFVQKALTNMQRQGLDVDFVCPTHGVVWTKEGFGEALALYERLSRFASEPGAVVLYGSMYGNTEQLADVIAQSLAAHGVEQVVCHNVSKSDPSVILSDIFRYRGLIIGSPTYCGELFSPIEHLLQLIRIRDVKDRLYAAFGSYTWAPGSVKRLLPFAEEMKWELVGEAVELKMSDLSTVLDAGWSLGQAMAERIKASCPPDSIQ